MKSHYAKRQVQHGAALIVFVLVLVLVATAALLALLDGNSVKIERTKKTAAALAEAKAALLGFAVGNASVQAAGHLPNPDLRLSPLNPEGSQAGNAGATDTSLIGKFPWYSLDTPPFKDGWNECLWYVVSGRYKYSPATSVLNWDTLGQIDVVDGNGNVLAANLAALIVSPDVALKGQDRSSVASDIPQCGGNYDARNYLDSYDVVNAIAGEVNYFVGSTNNRQASNTGNKVFVFAKNDFYNDRFVFVTVDDIFRPIMRRSDFTARITALLADPYLQTVTITGNKGTDSVSCAAMLPSNKTFCDDWKEMLLLSQRSTPAPIKIDGMATTAPCSRVLIFGGQKTGAQARLTATDKNDPANYLEGQNLTAFNTPSDHFNGVSTFDAADPSADVLRCL